MHVQHPGTDNSTVPTEGRAQPPLPRPAKVIGRFLDRARDVSFAIDRLEGLQSNEQAIKEKIDLGRVGVAGHGWGGATALAVAGGVTLPRADKETKPADPRIQAVVVLNAKRPAGRKAAMKPVLGEVPCTVNVPERN